jgi:hypothetical protein
LPVCCPEAGKGGGDQEAGASPARSRHCDREAKPEGAAARAGRPGMGIRESGDWSFAHGKPGRGVDPEKEVFVERDSLEQRISLEEVPLWSWLLALLLLGMLFALLSASGELLAPLLGQAAGLADYVHEFAHDGRHLLAIPCH